MPVCGKGAVAFILLLLLAPIVSVHAGEASAPSAKDAQHAAVPSWAERVRLSGILEADFEWMENGDAPDAGSGNSSDVFISTAELGVEVILAEGITGTIVLLAEDLGKADGDDASIDQATLTFHRENSPLSLVVGKRTQPFGAFENYLVADPMTQDAYETNRPGVTVAVTGPMGLECSATVYLGEEMMSHLFESDLFDTAAITRASDPPEDDPSSYILAVSVRPLGGPLTVFGSFLSEPGTNRRNNTAGVGVHFEAESLKGLRIGGEYMKAVDRERYAGFGQEFLEGVVSMTVAYEFVVRKRDVAGEALYEEKRARLLAGPIEIAARYEHFDDDGMADASQTFSVEDRYGAGGRYTIFRDPDRGLAVYLAGEYRHTDFRVHPSQEGILVASNEEVIARLGLTF